MKCESLYIHIPFCKTICSYCDFCKVQYYEKWSSKYLDVLECEIRENYHGESLSTIYIGGGTPNALGISELERLLQIVSALPHKDIYEYTVECNVELLTIEQIQLFRKYGVNRVSLGVQTFQKKFLTFLNRHHTKEMVIEKVRLLRLYGITNINIDLMYAFPNERVEDVINDIDEILKLNVPHISSYSLMLEPHTLLYHQKVEPIDEELDAQMYDAICKKLKKYNHYEISNFSRTGYESKHNLTYWNNENYYGFGLGASGYIDKMRYTNTFSLENYLNRKYIKESHVLSKQEIMENEMMLGLRKLKGVSLSNFFRKFNQEVLDTFPIHFLIEQEQLLICGDYIKINSKYMYISNNILMYFIGGN